MPNYIEVVSRFAPTAEVSAVGDPSVYSNLVWGVDTTPVSQASLDDWVAANPNWDAVAVAVTKYEFRKLFTFTERVAIDNFTTNESISAQNKAILSSIIKDLELSGEVQLDNPDVINGVGFLEQIGLLGTGRAARILANLPPL